MFRRNIQQNATPSVNELQQVQAAQYIGKRQTVTGCAGPELSDPFRQFDRFGRFPVHDPDHCCNGREKIVEIIGTGPVCLIALSPELRIRHLSFGPRQVIFPGLFHLAFSGETVIAPVPVVKRITILRIDQCRISKRIFHHKQFPFHSSFLNGKTETVNRPDQPGEPEKILRIFAATAEQSRNSCGGIACPPFSPRKESPYTCVPSTSGKQMFQCAASSFQTAK